MRTFLAIPIPYDLGRSLEALQRKLSCGRLVDAENFHITLAFLDDISEETAEELHDLLEGQDFRLPPIQLKNIGQFGRDPPRALWVGAEPLEGLAQLSTQVLRAARRVGLQPERRRFVPHVTLARFGASTIDPFAIQRFVAAHAAVQFPAFAAQEITMFQSILGASGPTYVSLASYPVHANR